MIKLIPEQINFNAECCSCMSTANCYELVVKAEEGLFLSQSLFAKIA